MTYKTVIPLKVKAAIDEWKLPREILLEVYRRLVVVLPSNPDSHLRDRVVPLDAWEYSFTLVDNRAMPHQRWFLFVVERREYESQLRIIGCRCTTDEAGAN